MIEILFYASCYLVKDAVTQDIWRNYWRKTLVAYFSFRFFSSNGWINRHMVGSKDTPDRLVCVCLSLTTNEPIPTRVNFFLVFKIEHTLDMWGTHLCHWDTWHQYRSLCTSLKENLRRMSKIKTMHLWLLNLYLFVNPTMYLSWYFGIVMLMYWIVSLLCFHICAS